MLAPVQKEFDDLSPEAQAIVRKEFADRPQELQNFIQRKSPTGSISSDAQKIIDDATDVIHGKKEKPIDTRFDHAQGIFDEKVGTPENIATQKEIDEFVDYSYKFGIYAKTEKPIPKQKDRISIAPVAPAEAEYIKNASGIDISNMTHVLRDNDIRHVKKSHGEDTNEKFPVTAEDQKKIPEIIRDYDDILFVDGGDKKGIVYVKRHNGVTYYLEAVREDENALVNKQMIKVSTGTIPDIKGIKEAINKKWGSDSSPNDSEKAIPRVYVRDVWNESSFVNSLSREEQIVNRDSSPKSDTEESIFDADVPMLHIDGSVRTYAEYKAEQDAAAQAENSTTAGEAQDQKIIDDATDVIYGKKKSMPNGVDVKVSATMPSDTVITADTNGVVAVDASFTPGIAKVTDVLSKRTGLKFGYAEHYQNGKKNAAYNGHYDPTTKTIYFRKGASKAEIIYKTAVHELTHFAESSKHYAYVSDFVLNKKFEGVDSDAYKKAVKEKIAAYAKNGIELTPEEARRELVAENIREVIFKSKKDVDNLVRTDYTFAQRILDIIDSFIYHFNNKFGRLEGDAKIHADLEQAQRKYRLALASAKGVSRNGKSVYEFVGTYYDGRKVYKTNYPKGTESRVKSEDIINFVQNIWQHRPITLSIAQGEEIVANFNPELDERSDLSKIAFGNKKGKASEKRMTLDMSADLYLIASDSRYNGSKSESGKDSVAHDNVRNWLYFVTNLIYEDEQGEHIPCHMNIDVKQRGDGNYFYSFAIEKGVAPQTLLAAVAGNNPTTTPNVNIPQSDPTVKNQFSFSSPKSDTEESIFDADVPMLHIDGSVRTYAEYRAEQEATAQATEAEVAHQNEQQDFAPAPGVKEPPTDNADVAAVVDAKGNKRTDDIELQYSQRLKGKNSMLFKDISRVLDYVCDKMPGVRDFWRNRIEKPFWRAKASFTSRSRQYLTDLKTTAEELGIRIGSKESAAAYIKHTKLLILRYKKFIQNNSLPFDIIVL